MPEFLEKFFSSGAYMPHGFCLRWDPALLLVFIAGNVGIAVAYFAIPAALYYFVRKRQDLPYPWMFRLFGAFIIACGLTHTVKVWTLYQPVYWLEASIDAITAGISLATAFLLWPLIPKALALPRPAELERANRDLQDQINARKEVEASLQKTERTFELLVSGICDYAIYMVDKDGIIQTWNSGAETITGYPAAEVIGKHFSMFYTQEDIVSGKPEFELRIAAQDGSFEDLGWRMRKNGTRFWANIIITAIRDEEGRLLGFGKVIRDLSERKQSEEELLLRTHQLEEVNQALEVARDAALESSHLKSAFVATISHELRTPLSGILGMNELLLLTELNEEQQSMALAVQDASRSLLAILNDVLDISKIEAGRMQLESVELNPIEIAHDCVQLLRPAAEQKHILISTDIDARIPSKLFGDPVRLNQVLLNLVANAVKFTLQGSVTLRALVEAEEDTNVVLKFSVTDTGIGLSEEERRFLFKPFTQVDHSSTRRFGGTGLGLSISKSLVEMMGGEIGVTSTKGQGSTFWFCVPFHRSATDTWTTTTTDTSAALFPPDLRVLVVEDNPIIQKLVLTQLENLGVDGRGVADGQAAIEELKRRRYGLVLMDCHLPVMDGYEATRRIRASEGLGGKHLPIVAMTAGAMKGDREKCLETGMDEYLSKPYGIEQLRQAMLRALSWSKDSGGDVKKGSSEK